MDFVILKVNGQDVSNSSHEDAVRCFQSAQEPIIVEVVRRQPMGQRITWKDQEKNEIEERTNDVSKKDHKVVACRTLVSTAVQTDWGGLLEEEELMPEPLGVDEQANDSFEDFLAHDIDFEEVTLRKSGSAEKLGLMVCYSSGSGSEDADTEVYISEIVPESLAARDGRLREGDQILRVNGRDVANKEQTENLFAETKSAVTILVSRCLYQDDEFDDRRTYRQESPSMSPEHLPSYQNSLIEQLIRQQQQQTEERTKETEDNTSTLKAPPPIPSHTSQQQQSSGAVFSTTSSSTCSSQTSQKSGRNASSPAHHTEDRKQWLQDTVKDCSKKMEGLSVRSQQTSTVKLTEAYSSHVWSETEHIYETIPESDSEPIYSSPYEHQHWNHANHGTTTTTTTVSTMTNAQNQTTRWHSSSKSNSSGEEKDSSSAYNTGESCNSNPLTLKLHQSGKDLHRSTLVLCPPKTPTTVQQQRLSCTCPASGNKQQTRNQTTRRSGSGSHHHKDRDTTNLTITALPADTMYTNMANLHQTMLLQQQLFKQALSRRNLTTSTTTTIAAPSPKETSTAKKSKSHGNFQAPNLTRYQFVGSQQVCTSTSWAQPEDKGNDVQMKWKVMRRADGSRYIARRTVRDRILRNRAIKISEERAGHSTEDDTMSEIKIGRYWTKEERKRQLERARERKQRQQELMLQQQQQQQLQLQQTNDLLACDHADEKLVKKPLNIVELSHKKMARKKNTLDDFTTVQEMLVHGNRVGGAGGPGPGGKLMGLLSVTTV
ncbi:PDZ domain-containing protein 4 isoform X1 [Hylaeus anthracinus]|uniref:PDZ domain-containing protein 4 isoform X1 n=2 Tax=Hylaeus anthracinus TaxID=313031 RepID=UPI0023B920ED|nr:PDZ domain-containing protein 4 isoform X1 [Hylaeus anthracinus]